MAKGSQKRRAAKPGRKKPDWVGAVLDDWTTAADKGGTDQLGLDGAPDWVMRAWIECIKIVFPGGLPDAPEKMGPEFLGELLGRLIALERLFGGEVPLGPETRADAEKMEAAAGKMPRPENAKALMAEWTAQFTVTHQAVHQATLQATALATSAAHPEALAFHQGLARGLAIQPDELATSRTFERHTRTYFVLALHWRMWARCRSLREIHDHLCRAAGEQQTGSFKTFEKLCRKIGLKLRGRGRPCGAK